MYRDPKKKKKKKKKKKMRKKNKLKKNPRIITRIIITSVRVLTASLKRFFFS